MAARADEALRPSEAALRVSGLQPAGDTARSTKVWRRACAGVSLKEAGVIPAWGDRRELKGVPTVPIHFLLYVLGAAAVMAQAPVPVPPAAPAPANAPPEAAAQPRAYSVEPGTKILLNLINSISTRSAAVGDRVYLETAFPVLADGRIVIPPGSYVTGTITQVKRAGKVKGRAELFIRFDSLTLTNGVTRDFRARASSLDGDQRGKIDRSEGKIQGDTNKAGDAMAVATTAGSGAMIGGIA